jgi:hypothetical protein
MDMTMHLSRTIKGQEEIFNHGHTLRPRHRQLLFCIGNGISFGELCKKHPKCTEIEAMVNDLLQNGFVQTLRNMGAAHAAPVVAPSIPAPPVTPAHASADLEQVRSYVLQFLAGLVGTKSPAYRQMSEVQDIAGLKALLPMCRKVVAAVASPHQAAEMETEVAKRLGA